MQKKTVQLVDDLDGGEADETVGFGLDGQLLEIDLSSANAEHLREVLAPYVENARRASGRKTVRRRPASTSEVSPAGTKSSRKRAASQTSAAEKPAGKGKVAGRPAKRRGKGTTSVTFVEPAASDVRAWALSRGMSVAPRGRVSDEVKKAFLEHSAPSARRTT